MRPEGVRVEKVKAHATRLERAIMGTHFFRGNEHADRLAKQGAALHQHEE